MPLRFSMLASGSSGNAALVRTDDAGLLIDLGLGPRALADRIASAGGSIGSVACALLTHTHGDHAQDAAIGALLKHRIPLYCHDGHRGGLARFPAFGRLEKQGLVKTFDDRPFLTPLGLRVEAIELSHDGGPTFGFRLEGRASRGQRPSSVGYLADTGCWHEGMADDLADVDLLALEFNHDVDLQRRSGRSWHLIARNLGERGHLSNEQAGEFLSAIYARSRPGAVKDVVLLHLSRQCNRPELAIGSARAAGRSCGRRSAVHVALQAEASASVSVSPARRGVREPEPAGAFPWELS
jgi:phosphoribosyl 1,2-cyclic phosphodiesterase